MTRLKRFISKLCGYVAYPRSVFDLSPLDLDHFPPMDDAESLSADWRMVAESVKKVAWRVYVRG